MTFISLDDFRQWDLPPIENYKPSSARPPLAKFDGEPIYRREYVPKNMKPPEAIKPLCELKLSNAPFKGDTNYRTEFVPHEIEPRLPIKPALLSRPKAPFEKLTTNRKDYTAKEFCEWFTCSIVFIISVLGIFFRSCNNVFIAFLSE